MNINDYVIKQHKENKKWYICEDNTSVSMSYSPTASPSPEPEFPKKPSKHYLVEDGIWYFLIIEDIPGNSVNEGFKTKKDAKIALLIYAA